MVSKEEVIRTYENLIGMDGSDYNEWYIGITNDIERRLYAEHSVRQYIDKYDYNLVTSGEVASEIEMYFLEKGCDGHQGGTRPSSRWIYIYKKAPQTNP